MVMRGRVRRARSVRLFRWADFDFRFFLGLASAVPRRPGGRVTPRRARRTQFGCRRGGGGSGSRSGRRGRSRRRCRRGRTAAGLTSPGIAPGRGDRGRVADSNRTVRGAAIVGRARAIAATSAGTALAGAAPGEGRGRRVRLPSPIPLTRRPGPARQLGKPRARAGRAAALARVAASRAGRRSPPAPGRGCGEPEQGEAGCCASVPASPLPVKLRKSATQPDVEPGTAPVRASVGGGHVRKRIGLSFSSFDSVIRPHGSSRSTARRSRRPPS